MSTSHASRRSEHSRSRSKVDVLLSRFVAHGALAPCPLCPMLGEFLPSINVTEPYVNLTAAAADICDICETIGVDAAALILENDCL